MKKKNPADDTGRNRKATRKMILALEDRIQGLEIEISLQKDYLKKIMSYFKNYFIRGKK